MAKFLTPYPLYPIIEHGNFLGISDDALADCVVVTLSKNMVIRLRLSDQTVLNSWNSKVKLTAPVVYDFLNSRFIGVFNDERIAFWQDDATELNDLKKYKFTWRIHSVVVSKELPPHIVYMNGCITPLSLDKDSRKEPSDSIGDFLSTSENIEEVKIISISGNIYVSLYCVSTEGEKNLILIPTQDGKKRKLTLQKKGQEPRLLGYTIIESVVITLWSNGNLNIIELSQEDSMAVRLVGKIDFVNLSSEVTLFPVSKEQIGIYGAQANAEGAILAIYSLKFGVVETSEKLKIYNTVKRSSTRPKELIVPSGANLLVFPYQLHKTRLAGLIGSVAQSLSGSDLHKDAAEYRISESLIPDLVEKKVGDELLKMLCQTDEVPEKYLMMSLGLAYNLENKEISDALIHHIFSRPIVGEENVVSLIRANIDFNWAITLINKLIEMISSKAGCEAPCDWISLLLQAYYQQIILSKDSYIKVTMKNALELITRLTKHLEVNVTSLDSEIRNIRRENKPVNALPSQYYTIETIQLY